MPQFHCDRGWLVWITDSSCAAEWLLIGTFAHPRALDRSTDAPWFADWLDGIAEPEDQEQIACIWMANLIQGSERMQILVEEELMISCLTTFLSRYADLSYSVWYSMLSITSPPGITQLTGCLALICSENLSRIVWVHRTLPKTTLSTAATPYSNCLKHSNCKTTTLLATISVCFMLDNCSHQFSNLQVFY